ncbi:MAG TPA: anaerobic glycerol-3-phosphate dehydrogenase subunit GlpB [Thermoleophilaceae bacterium]|jgi:glycerol-3-phosphate dehydrogenase subunit B
MRPSLHYDVLVVGAGVAGLTAGARLAESGARVCVLAKGVGSTHLAAGTVDVLGYDPDRVESPASALPAFVGARPDHPYALLGVDAVGPAVDWFATRVERGPQPGYRYVGSLERNHLLPSAVGAARPSALVPETMAGGDLGAERPVCIVGTRVLREFHASLCAGNITRLGIESRALEVKFEIDRPEVNALGLGRRFDDPAFRRDLAARLGPLVQGDERVGLPAVLGLRDPHGAWSDLQERLGRPVFEIPTLPPSVPGMRMFEALRAALRAAGGRLVMGARVVGAEREGARVTALRVDTAGRETIFGARSVVLATGGFASGGLALGSDWMVRETMLDLPLRGVPPPGSPRFRPEYFDEQPMAPVGVAVEANLRAEGTENVLVAGAALPGAEPWREGSGEGISLTSGYRAAELVLASDGVAAAA